MSNKKPKIEKRINSPNVENLSSWQKLAIEYIHEGSDGEHDFAKQVRKHEDARNLFETLSDQGVEPDLLIDILARGIMASIINAPITYSKQLSIAQSQASSLAHTLSAGPLFDSPAEQLLLQCMLHRIQHLNSTKSPNSSLASAGKKYQPRILRYDMEESTRELGITFNAYEFATLCSIADPDINFETARKEFNQSESKTSVSYDNSIMCIYREYKQLVNH